MCVDPVTLLTIGSTLVGAVGTVAQGQSAAAAAEYQQKQQTMLAEDALARGAQEEEGQRRKTAALAARQRAVMAASNVDLGSGSPLAILGDTAMLGELDAQVIKDNARRQQSFHKGNAVLAGMEGKAASTAGIIGGFSTVLGGATQMASSWYKPGKGGGGYDPWAGMRSKS